MNKQKEERFWTVPNFFSMLRIFLIPLFLYMLLQNKALHAMIVFLFASSTDVLDGMTARIWDQKTKIGGLLDPAADKLLMTTAIIILSIPSVSQPNTIPLWLTVAIIGRDIAIVSAAFLMYKLRGHPVCAPVERSGQNPRLSLVAVHPHGCFNYYLWLCVWIEGNSLV